MAGRVMGSSDSSCRRYLMVHPHGGGFVDLLSFLFASPKSNVAVAAAKFISSHARDDSDTVISNKDHRWVILVSIMVRKIIAVVGKPMEWSGCLVEFILNLLSHNGQLFGLILNLITGKVVIPHRDSDTFISAIGHLDGRVDLYGGNILATRLEESKEIGIQVGDRAIVDFCMMASKLAYENAKVVENIVEHHWKMHFVKFLNGWNDFQQEKSTQVFILSDKPEDANLILVSFRGTEPFDPDDWSTDFDYSWYEIPELGKVHMGFLEALGLGSRSDMSTFHNYLQNPRHHDLNHTGKSGEAIGSCTNSPANDVKQVLLVPAMKEMTAYYGVRSKLRRLLKENVNAKFVVTGHSLGGALAILFPTVLVLHEENEMMERLLGIYTFGQPRVGDRQLGMFMESNLNYPNPKYFRVVYCNDLVPRLPYDDMTFLYKHFGLCVYYDSKYNEQEVEEEPNKNYFGMRFLIPEYVNAIWELIRSFTMGYTYGKEYKEGWFRILLRVVGLTLPGISAHCPTDYVNSVRLGRQQVMGMSNFVMN